MALRFRIGTKIFALALGLLSITVALSIFGTWESRSLRRELVREASRDLPLEDILMGLDQHGPVKGRGEPVVAYELLGLSGLVSEDCLTLCARYEEALAAYRKLDWPGAAGTLRLALEIFPGDGPANVLLSRIERFQMEPPAADWDGVWHLAEK